MRQHFPAIIAGLLAGGLAGYAGGHLSKPKPVAVYPQTTVIAQGAQDRVGANPTKGEQRRASASWGDLAQPEVDALTAELKKISKSDVVIFCDEDSKCGDLALDLENAFESARWKVDVQRPFADDTVGIATSREDLRAAIEKATSGRLKVKMLERPPFDATVVVNGQQMSMKQPDVIALGKKPK